MSRSEGACDAIDLVAATVDTLAGIIENDIFGVDLVHRCASALRVVFTKDVLKIPYQQGRNAVRHMRLLLLKRFGPYEHRLIDTIDFRIDRCRSIGCQREVDRMSTRSLRTATPHVAVLHSWGNLHQTRKSSSAPERTML